MFKKLFVRLLFVSFCIYDTHLILRLNGQSIAIQSFTQSAGYATSNQSSSIQLGWHLDLGATTFSMNQTPDYIFTPGFIQPNIYRFSDINRPSNFDPNILVRYQSHTQSLFMFSKESDLIIFGYHVFDFSGSAVFICKTKMSSSHLALNIPIPFLSNGVYYILIYYLPENISPGLTSGYWTKSFKIIKQ